MTPNPQQMQMMMLMRAIAGRRQQAAQPPTLQQGDDGKYTLGGRKVANVADLGPDAARDKKLQKALGIEDLFKKEFIQGSYNHDNDYTESTAGPELQKALSRYQQATINLNSDFKQSHYVDRETGKIVYSDRVRERDAGSLKKGVQFAAPLALAFFGAPLGNALGGSLGLSGAAAKIAGTSLLSGGTTALMGGKGSDILKSMALAGAGSGIGAYGASAGWNPAVTQVASKAVPGLISGRDPRQVLLSAALGQFNPTPNAGFNNLMRTIIGSQLGGRKP